MKFLSEAVSIFTVIRRLLMYPTVVRISVLEEPRAKQNTSLAGYSNVVGVSLIVLMF